MTKDGFILALACALTLACVSTLKAIRPSLLDVVCARMLIDDPDLRVESIVDYGETTPRFYYGALLGSMHVAVTKDNLLKAERLDSKLTISFTPNGLERPQKCRMTRISPAERRQHWNDWLVEVSPIVKNIYSTSEEYGVFARGTLGGGQSGRYYWIQINPDGTAGRTLPLDVSESP
jgi:hypothetical protein